MSLHSVRGSPPPEGAVTLSREDALNHQKGIIRDWHSESDVLFLRYGSRIAGLSSATTSLIVTNYFKNTLNVGWKGLLFTYIPSFVIPYFGSLKTTETILTNKILLMTVKCPVCEQLKFALTQFYLGIVFPTVYAYCSYYSMALASNPNSVPDVKPHTGELWKYTFRVFKQGAPKFYTAGLIQSLVVLFLPYLQNVQFLEIMAKINNFERETEESIAI